jgi:hypothetical protein
MELFAASESKPLGKMVGTAAHRKKVMWLQV